MGSLHLVYQQCMLSLVAISSQRCLVLEKCLHSISCKRIHWIIWETWIYLLKSLLKRQAHLLLHVMLPRILWIWLKQGLCAQQSSYTSLKKQAKKGDNYFKGKIQPGHCFFPSPFFNFWPVFFGSQLFIYLWQVLIHLFHWAHDHLQRSGVINPWYFFFLWCNLGSLIR